MPLSDSFGREHNYMRISLTDRCNLRCLYCMPHNDMQFMPPSKLMSAQEIEEFAQIFVSLGVTKIRLTGGEPLIRKDAAEIIERLGKLPVELTITTNGFFLDQYFETLKTAGVRSLNLSLDTLKKERFTGMTQRDSFDRVWQNIQQAIELGFRIKLNVVVMIDQNEDEINDFVELTREWPIHVRFIEFMPFADNNWQLNKTVSYARILEIIGEEHPFEKIADAKNDTAKNFHLPNSKGTFAIISSVTNPFCDTCNRIRLTADGKIKNCLFAQTETDLLTAMRSGEDVTDLIVKNIGHKFMARGGLPAFQSEKAETEYAKNRNMISIGG
jgi:GTP 3',8-cyclase